jgi:hypothetical protein
MGRQQEKYNGAIMMKETQANHLGVVAQTLSDSFKH